MADYKDIFELLIADHDEVKTLFKKFQDTSANSDKKEIWKKISKELSLHTAIEEQYFYPKLEGFKELHDKILEGIQEHKQVEEQMMKLDDTSLSDENWDSIAKVIFEDVQHHIQEEQEKVFPLAKKMLIEDEQKKILDQMLETKKEEK